MSVDATRFVWKLPKDTVSPLEKLILLAIADRCCERGECWPSISRICKDTNLSEDAVRRNRASLIEKGLLIYTGKFEGRSKQIPVMKLAVKEWREGEYFDDEIDPPVPATPSHERGVPLAEKGGYPPVPATQNLKEESKLEPKNNNNGVTSKNEYKETYFPMEKKSSNSMTALQLISQNPHNVPLPMIEDWIRSRKGKKAAITATAWNRINKELSKCDDPVDAFEQMVAAGWQSIKAEWVNKKRSVYDNQSTEWIHGIQEDLF
jgi:pyocin large subunit-like protein